MRDQQLNYEHPGAAAALLLEAYERGELGIDELRQRESDVALADGHCYGEVGLPEMVERLEYVAQESIADGAREVVREFEAMLHAAVDRAATTP